MATLSAAHTQVAAEHKQWRDDSRRSAWLAYAQSADEVTSLVSGLVRGDLSYGPECEVTLSSHYQRLSEVEFEVPPEIFAIARQMHDILTQQLLMSAFINPYVVIRRRFDRILAEARSAAAVTPLDELPLRDRRIIESDQALSSLSSRRTHSVEVPSDALLEAATMTFAPFIQSAGREHREALTQMARGVATILLTTISTEPDLYVETQRKLQECGEFDQREIAGLLVDSASLMISTFEGSIRWLKGQSNQARKAFLRETDKHLSERLPVRR
ncbi:hypothetical protein [Streptomyces sp. NPDC017086]|uniref:hypothetical protein n=1 Tax=Streptomyces sp. NPDC017086 TaxID=3364976 RepID=UPI0037929E6A